VNASDGLVILPASSPHTCRSRGAQVFLKEHREVVCADAKCRRLTELGADFELPAVGGVTGDNP
jgi:hypothetical protein